jgi:hypothetical protein
MLIPTGIGIAVFLVDWPAIREFRAAKAARAAAPKEQP